MPIRARKDIKCYKVLRVTYEWDYANHIIVTPIMNCTVSRHGILQAKGKMQCIPINGMLFHGSKGYKIQEGAIHAYTSIDVAIENAGLLTISLITECIIKKGTLYCKSYNGKCIAAEEMEIVKVVEYPTEIGLKEFVNEYFTNLKSI